LDAPQYRKLRKDAVLIGQKLMECKLIEHVCQDHDFKDAKLLNKNVRSKEQIHLVMW